MTTMNAEWIAEWIAQGGQLVLAWFPFALTTTALVLAAVWAADRLAKGRVPSRWFVALYGLVFARLALPTTTSAGPAATAGTELDAVLLLAADGLGGAARPITDATAAVQTSASGPSLTWVLGLAYVAVAAVLLARLVVGAVRLRAVIAGAKRHDHAGSVRVLVHPAAGPFAAGLLRRVIVLPRSVAELAPPVARLVRRHELAHHRHGDLWVMGAVRVACALAWPLVPLWIAAARMRHHMELAADAWALGEATAVADRRNFARALTDYATSPVLAGAQLSQFANLSARIEAIVRPSSTRGRVLACAAALGPAVACAAVPVSEPEERAGAFDDPEPAEALADEPDAEAIVASDDTGTQAEELLLCGENTIATFNETATDDPSAPELLLRAADCYYDAGFFAKATFVLKALEKQYPETPHDYVVAEVRAEAVAALTEPEVAQRTRWGRYCTAGLAATGVEAASTADLIAAADCLGKPVYAAAALQLHRVLQQRQLGAAEQAHNEERIAMCERVMAQAEADRAAAAG